MKTIVTYLFLISPITYLGPIYGMEGQKKQSSSPKKSCPIKLDHSWRQTKNGVWEYNPDTKFYQFHTTHNSRLLAQSCVIANGQAIYKR